MNTDLILPIIARWAHVLSAIVAVGGSFFALVMVLPAISKNLDAENAAKVHGAIRARWQKVIHTCILLFLASGFYNYLAITRHLHPDQPLYHMLFGIKFMLAIGVFGFALVLTSRKSSVVGNPQRRKKILTLLVVLAITIVLISGVMKRVDVRHDVGRCARRGPPGLDLVLDWQGLGLGLIAAHVSSAGSSK